jgi:hypothetical protein
MATEFWSSSSPLSTAESSSVYLTAGRRETSASGPDSIASSGSRERFIFLR